MRGLLALGVWLATGLAVLADSPPPGWQTIRDKQPASLHMTVKLPKDHYFQGEEIDATVTFANDDPSKVYELELMSIPWIVNFHAFDEAGHEAVNPVDWYYGWYGFTYCGPVQMEKLGSYTASFPVNRTARFDHPGVYRIYGERSVMEKPAGPVATQVRLVSDPVTVTITPRTAEQEIAAIAEADARMNQPRSAQFFNPTQAGMDEAVYLQSRAGQDFILAHLDNPGVSQEAFAALMMTQDPSGAAATILQRVKAGTLVLSDQDADSYAILKTANLIRDRDPRKMAEKEAQGIFKALTDARKAAKQEVLRHAVDATAGDNAKHVEALWAAFQEQAINKNPGEPDRDGGQARMALAARQFDLSGTHVQELMNAWPYWGSADFRPLLQKLEEQGDVRALVALVEIDPEQERLVIIRDLASPYPKLFHEGYQATDIFGRMTPIPLPQFDGLFRQRLKLTQRAPMPTIALITAFGSSSLLLDVLAEYRDYGREHWDSRALECFFRYWLRCDPAGGATGMEAYLQAKGSDAISLFDDMFLRYHNSRMWAPQNRPVIRWSLEHGIAQLALNALSVAQSNGDSSWAEPVVATLERLHTDKEFGVLASHIARELLEKSRWPLTDAQKHRLESFAARAGT